MLALNHLLSFLLRMGVISSLLYFLVVGLVQLHRPESRRLRKSKQTPRLEFMDGMSPFVPHLINLVVVHRTWV